MADKFRLAIAVLAAGQSRRFGDADKLTASFRGKMLGLHVCDNLRTFDAAHRWVITARADHPCAVGWRNAGFEAIINPESAMGMGTSVALAARRALEADADALMICLADMPLVPADHYVQVIETVRGRGEGHIATTTSDELPMPPACFAKAWLTPLSELSGDKGAREFLARGVKVHCPPDLLIDIDTPETLARLDQ